ncbi:MAG: hypothetical protein AAGF14_03160 [Pseudomonadota bacterium]
MGERFFKDYSAGKLNSTDARNGIKAIIKFAETLSEDEKRKFNDTVGSICYYLLSNIKHRKSKIDLRDVPLHELPDTLSRTNYDKAVEQLLDFRKTTKKKRNKEGAAAADLVAMTFIFLHPKNTKLVDGAIKDLAATICNTQLNQFKSQI